jgi:hypothetical protein
MGFDRDQSPFVSTNVRKLRRRMFIAGCLLFGLLIWLGSGRAWAQPGSNDRPHYVSKSEFRIPFNLDPGNPRLLEIQLYVSEDLGQSWLKIASAAPEQGGFRFLANHDGLYYFTVRTVDISNKGSPPAILPGAPPQIRVCVDTQKPLVSLRQAPAREGLVGVEWESRDENLDVNGFVLEFRTLNSQDWLPLTVEGGRTGQRYWNPGAPGSIETRLRVRDLARNEGEAHRTINGLNESGGRSSNGESQQFGGNYNDPDAGRGSAPGSSRSDPRYVNSAQISLNYEIREEGPSGTSSVELWETRDTRNWNKLKEDRSHQPPLTFEVKDEGVYGFTLVAKSGVGLYERLPRSGDAPQVWVEVDLKRPEISFVHAVVDPGPETGKLTITWKATDKNLARNPISLSYSKEPEGPWTPIESGLPNVGSHVWRIPTGVPYQFYVQVEAIDKAGNIGKRKTQELVKVDLKKPRSVILEVAPAGVSGTGGSAGGNSKAPVDSQSNWRPMKE